MPLQSGLKIFIKNIALENKISLYKQLIKKNQETRPRQETLSLESKKS